MSRFRSAALAAALIGAFAATAQAQTAQPEPGRPGRGGQMGARGGRAGAGMLMRGITLSAAQQTQVKTIVEKYQVERRAMMESGGGMRDSTTRAQMLAMRQREQADLRNVLTGGQRTQFDANVAELRKRMDERGMGRGPGGARGAGRNPNGSSK